ncbi:hypothetical protein [Propionivibrio sp.]|uniref:hypothetical protein n=1 Tax=Propionivibrio sp. TaxID=2212460 RepID=UPI003BF3662C
MPIAPTPSMTSEGQEVASALLEIQAPSFIAASFESLNLPEDRWVLRVFVPLRETPTAATGTITGYFEGVRVSDSLIIAMNNGKPMAPKLMYEFPLAAMNVELKRGRSTVTRFLNRTYGDTIWTRRAVHDWLKEIRPAYVIDINRDTQLQDPYAATPHTVIVDIARLGGTDFRYKLYSWDGVTYQRAQAINPALPILFKPMGTPKPEPSYIASDADYVDFITELMGGFSIPPVVKELRALSRASWLSTLAPPASISPLLLLKYSSGAGASAPLSSIRASVSMPLNAIPASSNTESKSPPDHAAGTGRGSFHFFRPPVASIQAAACPPGRCATRRLRQRSDRRQELHHHSVSRTR